jgi:hypothetical protein
VKAATAQPEARRGTKGTLQAYLASLLYLRQEAQRDGLDAVAAIMWDALVALERWLDSGAAGVASQEMLNVPLCHALDFLLKWRALPAARQQKLAQVIADYESEASADAAAVPRRARVSRKTAG